MPQEHILSRDWILEAREQYQEKLHAIEKDLGECMQSCCRRDVKNQVYSRKLVERLQEHDPSRNSRRIPLEQQPLGQPHVTASNVGPAASTVPEIPHTDDRMVHGDKELEHVREQRKAQLKRKQAAQEAAAIAGYGQLTDVASVNELQERVSGCQAAVVHLWEAGTAQELDEHLTTCAQEYLGTLFLRAGTSQCKQWLQRQRCHAGPQLLCTRAGRVVASIGIRELQLGTTGATADGYCTDESSDFGSDEEDSSSPCIKEQTVRLWLMSRRVLHRSITVKWNLEGAVNVEESDSEAEENEQLAVDLDWRQPCTICGRTYPHEHKRAVRASNLCEEDVSD